MAMYPNEFNGQEILQPGARGEIFNANMPGYRDGADRLNRTNNNLNVSEHDVPNVKYAFDDRLPVLFKFGFAYGYNQIVIPKGRIVAVDPIMNLVDYDMHSDNNTLTIANGGVPVRVRVTGDKYKASGSLLSTTAQNQQVTGVNKEWIPVAGMEAAYDEACMRAFKGITTIAGAGTAGDPYHYVTSANTAADQLTAAGFEIDSTTGRVKNTADGSVANNVRPGNIPIGIIQRNEYTRDEDALNGIMPGPILTDAMVELPWFTAKDKAEGSPWGSAYGSLQPGLLLKSDENGRFTVSPLSVAKTVAAMDIHEYEAERQQVVGQVYAVNHSLLPEAAAKWATWALEDRLNSEEFYPALYKQNYRSGEDAISNSPYESSHKYPGFPYDKAYTEHDLHMLGSGGRMNNYDQRMNPEFVVDGLGIPGLTDGKNAYIRSVDPVKAGEMHFAGGAEYVDLYFRTIDTNVENLQISIGGATYASCVAGGKVAIGNSAACVTIKYADMKQGMVVLSVATADKAAVDTALDGMTGDFADVCFKYDKRGLAGVPTMLDWDGCVGSVKVLLTK